MASNVVETSLSVLLKEFESWSNEHNDSNFYLLESHGKDDGSADLLFCLAGEYDIILHCPSGYPKTEDSFLIETSYPTLQLWSSMMNEFLLDSPTTPSLREILSKAILTYSLENGSKISEDISSEEDAMEEDDEDILSEDDSAFTTEWELQLERMKKRWSQKEMEIRKQLRAGAVTSQCPELSFDIMTKEEIQTKQIFSTNASSGILANDLIELIQHENETGINAEAVDDNIYHWKVKLQKFEPNSALNNDLKIIDQNFHYSYVELMLTFTMDLYPFYPPLVKVVRPRFKGVVSHHVTNLEILKLTHWNPARSMQSVLQEIKKFLQEYARLEVNNVRNDAIKYPEGAYIPIEHSLLQLAIVGEISPRANFHFVFKFDKAPEVINHKKDKTNSKEFWAPGTGYGHRHRPGWDYKALIAATKLKDKQIMKIVQMIQQEIQEINNNLRKPQNNQDAMCNGVCDEGMQHPSSTEAYESLSECLTNCVSMTDLQSARSETNMDCSDLLSSRSRSEILVLDDPQDNLYSIVEGSALVPFLEKNLSGIAFLEISRHSELYSALFDMIKEIYSHPQLINLLGPLSGQKSSIYELLRGLNDEASQIISRIDKVLANGSVPKVKKNCTAANTNDTNLVNEEKLARGIVATFSELSKMMNIHKTQINFKECDNNTPPVSRMCDKNVEEMLYQKNLKDLQFINFSFSTSGSISHYFAKEYLKAHSQPPLLRIAQELTNLSKSLPLNLSSSIFIRMDEENYTLLKVMITGPEGTPYSGGCYLFDIYFPDQFPAKPPCVHLQTTGKGTVRFNPNLYQCGKVCLSLLGTWSGQKSEIWNETSTLLQVLVSIQSFIFIPEPYFNEPGYESLIGTPRGTHESRLYNEEIRSNNLYWAIQEQIRNPPPEFAEAIKRHFYFRRNQLSKEIAAWAEASPKLEKYVTSVKKELNNLKL